MESEVTVTPVTPAANAIERPTQSSRDQLASIAASVQAEEARMAQEAAAQANGTNAPAKPADQQGIVSPPEGAKKSVPAGLVDKDGHVSEEKILKANEHLEKGIKDKEARLEELLKRNKELRRKFGDVGQVVKETEASLSPEELTRKELDELEKNPVHYIKGSIKSEIQSIRAELEGMKAETRYTGEARELDSLVERGHSWIIEQGLGRFEEIFKERPYLLQSKTPYKDAVRFMSDVPSNGAAPGSAQAGRTPLPILGSGTVAPPPSQEQAASSEQRMEDLSRKLRSALEHNDRATAMRLMQDMDKLQRGY